MISVPAKAVHEEREADYGVQGPKGYAPREVEVQARNPDGGGERAGSGRSGGAGGAGGEEMKWVWRTGVVAVVVSLNGGWWRGRCGRGRLDRRRRQLVDLPVTMEAWGCGVHGVGEG